MQALPQPRYVCSLARQGLAYPHVEAFCSFAYEEKSIHSLFFLCRGLHSGSISDICMMCGKEAELVNHLLNHCEVASFIWSHFIFRYGILWSPRDGRGIGSLGLSSAVAFCSGISSLLRFYGQFGKKETIGSSRVLFQGASIFGSSKDC